MKGYGGAIGPTENPVAFKRWMLASPEQATLLTEFENQFIEEEEIRGASNMNKAFLPRYFSKNIQTACMKQ